MSYCKIALYLYIAFLEIYSVLAEKGFPVLPVVLTNTKDELNFGESNFRKDLLFLARRFLSHNHSYKVKGTTPA